MESRLSRSVDRLLITFLIGLLALWGFWVMLDSHPAQVVSAALLTTGPQITDASVQEDSSYLYGVGNVLFYTNTMSVKQTFLVLGMASGATTVTFSSALDDTPPADTTLPSFEASYDVAAGDTESGVITATASDLGGVTAIQTYTYTFDGAAPVGTIAGMEATSNTTVLLTLTAGDGAGCGVAEMCLSTSSTCSDWKSYTVTRSWSLSGADGPKVLYGQYRDYLGNTSGLYSTTIVLDRVTPVVTVTAPVQVDSGPFAVSWTASDAQPGAGLLPTYTVAYREDAGSWRNWMTTPLTRSQFLSASVGHTYVFSVTVYDRAGNRGMGSATTCVGDYTVYLPLVLKNYAWLANGDFELGTLAGWTALKGGFNGHGSGLPQSVTAFEGGQRALLGNPDAVHKSLPVGYGSIYQSFVAEKRYVTLKYRVVSYDIFKGTSLYFDTFEVSLIPPAEISDDNRNSRCVGDGLNPDDNKTIGVPYGTGLIFCGGRIGTAADTGTLQDLGWKTVTLDVSAYQGELITLYFTVWGREYNSPYYNDRGLYNTWVYVDDVTLHD